MSRFNYQATIRHDGLGKYRVIRGAERHIVEAAAYAQQKAWNEQYAKKLAAEERTRERQTRKQQLEDNINEAAERTREAEAAIHALQWLLSDTLLVDDTVRWESLKQNERYPHPPPVPSQYQTIPEEPRPDETRYQPQLGLMDKFWRAGAERKVEAVRALFEADHADWRRKAAAIEEANQRIYQSNVSEYQEWQRRSLEYENDRKDHNDAVERRCAEYQAKNPDAILDYCEMVLAQSDYPECLPHRFDLDFTAHTKTLVVDYQLPAPADLPRVNEVKYVRSKNAFVESEMSKKEFERFYERVVCQIAIRTLHELFESDVVNALDLVVFNGLVDTTNLGTGHRENRCIMSIAVDRATFVSVNLGNVDARMCFNSLGGIGDGKLVELNPVTPLGRVEENSSRGQDISDCSSATAAELHELAKSLVKPTDFRLMRVSRLASLFGFPKQKNYSPALSRHLASSVRARGFAVEPDSSLHGASYESDDQIVVFRPVEGNVSDTYLGALGLLQFCMRIAAADGDIREEELDVIREFIAANVHQTAHDRQRLHFFEKVLCRQPALAERSLIDLETKLSPEHRRILAEVLVCIAGADGEISSPEWSALDRAFKSLNLPSSTLEEILGNLGATFVEPTVQQAEPDEPGEPLPVAVPEVYTATAAQSSDPGSSYKKCPKCEWTVSGGSELICCPKCNEPLQPRDGNSPLNIPANIPSEEKVCAPAVTRQLKPTSATRTTAPGFKLDMSRVAAISKETAELVNILSAVMQEQEVQKTSTKPTIVTVVAKDHPKPCDVPSWLISLDSKYHKMAVRLIEKPEWNKSEFQRLAAEFKLMPLGVFDAINEWSDEHLGEFLLEGEDTIRVNINLIPK